MTDKETPARFFANVPVPDRPKKPREAGITVLIDWGMDTSEQSGALHACGEYIDLAKVAVGVAGLLPGEILAEKLNLYRKNEVEPFPGGQFLEYAVSLDKTDAFLSDAADAGFKLVEVSDNTVRFDPQFKRDLIRRAIEEYGFRVLGEVGSKVESTNLDDLVDDVRLCLDAGAWKVMLEAAEFMGDGVRTDLINSLVERLGADSVIFELPGWWLGHVGNERVGMTRALLGALGRDVNIANVDKAEVIFVETLRRKTGVTGFE